MVRGPVVGKSGKRSLTVSLSDEFELDSALSFQKQNGQAATVKAVVQNKPRTKRQKAKQGSADWHKSMERFDPGPAEWKGSWD